MVTAGAVAFFLPVFGHFAMSMFFLAGLGDGHTPSDTEVIDDHNVRLRAERGGAGSGRTYTITVTCDDSGGRRSHMGEDRSHRRAG